MHDVPVAAFADAKETAPMQSAAARLGFVALEVSAGDVLDGRGSGLLHAEIDPLAFGSAVASEQREHHCDRTEVRRRVIGLQTERTHRRVIGKAVDVEHPAERGQHGVVGDDSRDTGRSARTVRSNRAPARDSRDAASPIQGRAGRASPGAKLSITTSAERTSCKQNFGAARMLEVKRQRSLVEIVEPEKQAAIVMRQVVEERADAARVVAGGRLDLDNVGAHVGEQPRAKLCAMPRQVEDAQARERAGSGSRHGFFVGLRRGAEPRFP